MALIVIGIDTSRNKEYSMVLFGYKTHVDELYNDVSKILARYGKRGTIHWKTLSVKIRNSAKKAIYKAIKSKKVYFNIAQHKRPQNVDAKYYYLQYVPNVLSGFVEKASQGKRGSVVIEVDDDYAVKRVRNSTLVFTENFLSRLCFRLVGKMVKIRKTNDGAGFLATVKHPNGNVLNFSTVLSTKNKTKAVQLADLVLGYYLYYRGELRGKRIFFRKIK